MAADVKGRVFLGELDRLLESCAIGHQRSGSENPSGVRLDDSTIHVSRVPEVIRIHYKALQNRASLIRRNFFGFARISLIKSCISRVAPFSVS